MEETKKCKHCQSDIPKKAKVCPNCRKKQKHTGLGVFLIVVGVLVFLIALSGGSDDEKTQSEKATTNSNSVENEKTIEYLAVDVDTLMDTLNNNALKAKDSYQNQYLEITGRLAVIDSNGQYIGVFPQKNQWAITGVQCYVKDSEAKEKIMNLSTDDVITVRVKITDVGEVMGYSANIIEFVN